MNANETAVVLDRLASVFNHRITGEEYAAWSDYLDDLDSGLAAGVVEHLAKNHDGYLPTIAKFRETYREIGVARAKERRLSGTPNRDCGLCEGTEWVEVEAKRHADSETGDVRVDQMTVRPCQYCWPEGYERFLKLLPERNRVSARFSPPDGTPARMAGLAEAAEALRGGS